MLLHRKNKVFALDTYSHLKEWRAKDAHQGRQPPNKSNHFCPRSKIEAKYHEFQR